MSAPFYDRMIKDYRDYLCEMDAAEDRGKKRGLEMVMEQDMKIGIEMGKTEVAKNMLGMGLSIETISSATGLSQEAVAGLK